MNISIFTAALFTLMNNKEQFKSPSLDTNYSAMYPCNGNSMAVEMTRKFFMFLSSRISKKKQLKDN